MAVTISSIRTKKQLRVFEQVPEKIHREERYFVPPFPGSICKIFSEKSPFRRHGELYPFIAYRDNEPVGRITAIVNHTHNKYHNDRIGFFGFFDFIDDKEVASALLEKARAILKEKGLTEMRGPFNPSINDECGLLVEGFDSIPNVMMSYNPLYYVKMYEELGLTKACDLHAFYISSTQVAPERIKKIVDRVKRSTGIQFRSVNMKKLKDDLKIIHKVYNETLNRNWGFVPISYEDLEFAADDLKQIADPAMVLIAEKDGEPVGFSLALPNINELMWKAARSRGLLRVLKFIWYLKTQRPKEARLTVLGVVPQYRNKGIAPVFYYESLMRGKKYVGGELSWIEESNEEIIKAMELMGAKRYKNYRIFESPVGVV